MKKKELATLKRLAPRNSTLPALESVFVRKNRAFASNMETTISFPFTKIKGTGLVPADLFAKADFDSGKFMPDFSLELTKGRATWRIQGDDPDHYPFVFYEKGKKIGKFSDVELLRQVAPFASKNDLKPVMCGAYIGEKRITATDAHRLITLKRKSKALGGMIIPSHTIPFLMEDSYTAYESKDSEHIHLIGEKQDVIFRPIDGRYPNFPAVVPQKFKTIATVDRKALLDAVERAIPCANKASNMGKFVFTEKTLTVSSEDLDLNTSYSETLPSKWGLIENQFAIGFNLLFVKQALTHYKSEKNINIYLLSHNRAAYFNDILIFPMLCDDAGWKTDFNDTVVDSPVLFTPEEYLEFAPKQEETEQEETEKEQEQEPEKEVWQMTRAEYIEKLKEHGFEIDGDFATRENDVTFHITDDHKYQIEAAIAEGHEIPLAVMQEYRPDLKEETEPTTPEPQPESSIQDNEKSEDFSEEEEAAEEIEPKEEDLPETEPTPEPQEEETEQPLQPPAILQYSEKSFVVIGDTKPLRKKLKEQKGKWIPKGLKFNDEPIVGWIFSNKRRDAVEQILNA